MAGEHEEYHEVVQLLLARMESHPEEFQRGMSRWAWMVESAMTNASEEERAALHAGLRPIRLQQLHEDVLDELLNGEDRRRLEREEQEYERNLLNRVNNNNMGASLRAAISPALQQIDAQMQMEAAKNAYNVLKLTTTTKKD